MTTAIETDLEHVKAHTRLEVRAIEWDKQKRDESYLLRGTDLDTAETGLLRGAGKQPQPTELQGQYVSASQAAERAQRRREVRRQQAFLAVVGTFAVLALGAAGFAFQQRQDAFAQRQEAQGQRREAESQKVKAQEQSQRAERETQTAQTEKRRAETALNQAEAAKKTAEARTRETKVALAKAQTARQSEAQQRQVAQQRQQEALTAKAVADQQTVEAQQQRNNAETQKQTALAATDLVEKRRENAELNAQSLKSLNLSASNLTLEALAEGLKAGHKLKQWEKDLNGGTQTQVKAALQQVVYGINERNRLQGHSGVVSSVSFSPDGKTIATGSFDNTVKLWDLQGQERQTLKGHSGNVNSVSFSPDGKTIATGSEDTTVILWNLDLDSLMTLGCDWLSDYRTHNPDGQSDKDLNAICKEMGQPPMRREVSLWERVVGWVWKG